jgi:hypothetical protein
LEKKKRNRGNKIEKKKMGTKNALGPNVIKAQPNWSISSVAPQLRTLASARTPAPTGGPASSTACLSLALALAFSPSGGPPPSDSSPQPPATNAAAHAAQHAPFEPLTHDPPGYKPCTWRSSSSLPHTNLETPRKVGNRLYRP